VFYRGNIALLTIRAGEPWTRQCMAHRSSTRGDGLRDSKARAVDGIGRRYIPVLNQTLERVGTGSSTPKAPGLIPGSSPQSVDVLRIVTGGWRSLPNSGFGVQGNPGYHWHVADLSIAPGMATLVLKIKGVPFGGMMNT
jgi:hypothetical protein